MNQPSVSARRGKPGGRSAARARYGMRSRLRSEADGSTPDGDAHAGTDARARDQAEGNRTRAEPGPSRDEVEAAGTSGLEIVEIALDIDATLLEEPDVARELALRYLAKYLAVTDQPAMSRGELGLVLERSGWIPVLDGKPAAKDAVRDFVRDELGRGARQIRYRGDGARQAMQRYHRTLAERGQAMNRASARLAEQSYADEALASFYIAQVNAPANLINGVTGLLSAPLQKAGLPGIPEIPRFDMVGEYGAKHGKTLETGAVLGLGLVAGATGVAGEVGAALRGVEAGGVAVGSGAVTAGKAYAAGSAALQLHDGTDSLAEDLLLLEFGTLTEGETTRDATDEEKQTAHDRVVERLGDAALGVLGVAGFRAQGGKPASGRSDLPVARARPGAAERAASGEAGQRDGDGKGKRRGDDSDDRDAGTDGEAPRAASRYRDRDADRHPIDPRSGLSEPQAARHRDRIDDADRQYGQSGDPADLQRALDARYERYRQRMGNKNPPATPWDRVTWESRNPQLRQGVIRAREVEPEALRAAGVERRNDAAGQYRQYTAVDPETGRTTTTRPDGLVGRDVVETKYVSPDATGQTVYKTRQLEAQQDMARSRGGEHRVIVSSEDGARLHRASPAPRPSGPLTKRSEIEFYDAAQGRITHVWDKSDGKWIPIEEKPR